MNLYIQIENGQPINHPAFENNLIEAFGQVPSYWEPFIRLEKPKLGPYQIFNSEESTYQKINGAWTDVWDIQEITEEEKTAKQQTVKNAWAARDQADNWSAWVFDETTCSYQCPVTRPTDRLVIWSRANNSWVDAPQRPDDGKNYKLDFYTSSWVEVTP
jgi:hypothetical protein